MNDWTIAERLVSLMPWFHLKSHATAMWGRSRFAKPYIFTGVVLVHSPSRGTLKGQFTVYISVVHSSLEDQPKLNFIKSMARNLITSLRHHKKRQRTELSHETYFSHAGITRLRQQQTNHKNQAHKGVQVVRSRKKKTFMNDNTVNCAWSHVAYSVKAKAPSKMETILKTIFCALCCSVPFWVLLTCFYMLVRMPWSLWRW